MDCELSETFLKQLSSCLNIDPALARRLHIVTQLRHVMHLCATAFERTHRPFPFHRPSEPLRGNSMSFSRLKAPLLALALAGVGSAHAATILSEGFEGVTLSDLATSGWVMTNLSSPVGTTGWFVSSNGNQFDALAGSSYMAANYNSSTDVGTVDNWLITPAFSTAAAGTVSVYLKGSTTPGFTDTVKFGFSNGSSSTSAFTLMSSTVSVASDWTQYTFAYAASGAASVGRFAIEYVGLDAGLDFVGVDSFTVSNAVSAVPEPATWAMFALGMLGVAASRRRSQR
jgi:hypothetical protein